MAKSLISKIMKKCESLKLQVDLNKYMDDLSHIDSSFVNITHDDLRTLCNLMSRGLDNICYRWQHGKTLHSASIERFVLHHGEVNGPIEYEKSNQKKKAGLSNTIEYWTTRGFTAHDAAVKIKEIQTTRSKKSPASKKGSRLSPRTLEHWLNKGLSITDAEIALRKTQTTNGLQYYVSKYGEENGLSLFLARIEKWQTSRKSNPNYTRSCYLQGHGFDQYEIRYGENALSKWTEYKKRFAKRGSKESELAFTPIIDWLKFNNIDYNFGPHNCEYIIVADKKAWFFDLTIPSLKIVIEYHGYRFHPNPELLSEDEWNNWKNPFNGESAEIQYQRDCRKQQIAEQHGFTYYTVFSTEHYTRVPEILDLVKRAKSLSDNSTSIS